jgi:hypothetical protein
MEKVEVAVILETGVNVESKILVCSDELRAATTNSMPRTEKS